MIFLDYHPEAPKAIRTTKGTSRVACEPQKIASKNDDVSWQVKWMDDFNDMRQQLTDRLQKSEEVSEERFNRIKWLEKEAAKIPELQAENVKSQGKIREMEIFCERLQVETKEKATQTNAVTGSTTASTQTNIVSVDQCVQTMDIVNQRFDDDNTMEIPVSEDFIQQLESITQFDGTMDANQRVDNTTIMEVAVSADCVQHDHAYAKINGEVVTKWFKYHCIDCKFATNKKSAYDDHKAENCVEKPEKNMKCAICGRWFTYRTLRHHLNYYATGRYKANGKHAEHTPSDHMILLEQHKQLKKK